MAEEAIHLPDGVAVERIDHHEAHAAAAFRLSPFESAAVLVCDSHRGDTLSAWAGKPDGLTRLDWPRSPWSFANLDRSAPRSSGSREASITSKRSRGSRRAPVPGGWRMPSHGAIAASRPTLGGGRSLPIGSARPVPPISGAGRAWPAPSSGTSGTLAARRLVARYSRVTPGRRRLCLGGGLFYNTSLRHRSSAESGIFDDVHVPAQSGQRRHGYRRCPRRERNSAARCPSPVSPFLGPDTALKRSNNTLDNCKLSYECLSDSGVVETAARALCAWPAGRVVSGPNGMGPPCARPSQHPGEPFVGVRARQPECIPQATSASPSLRRERARGRCFAIFRRPADLALDGVRLRRRGTAEQFQPGDARRHAVASRPDGAGHS